MNGRLRSPPYVLRLLTGSGHSAAAQVKPEARCAGDYVTAPSVRSRRGAGQDAVRVLCTSRRDREASRKLLTSLAESWTADATRWSTSSSCARVSSSTTAILHAEDVKFSSIARRDPRISHKGPEGRGRALSRALHYHEPAGLNNIDGTS